MCKHSYGRSDAYLLQKIKRLEYDNSKLRRQYHEMKQERDCLSRKLDYIYNLVFDKASNINHSMPD